MFFFGTLISSIYNIATSFICYLPLIILALLGLCFLVVFHEFGHFIFAKIFNVYTPSFSIGFGPELVQKKIGDTTFKISAIPLGGYVEMAGSAEIGQGDQEHAHQEDDRSFSQKPYWQQMIIISGGIIFNLIFAYLAMTLLFYMGSPCIISTWCSKEAPKIDYIVPDSAAYKSGLKKGDTILAINNKEIKNIGSFNETLQLIGKNKSNSNNTNKTSDTNSTNSKNATQATKNIDQNNAQEINLKIKRDNTEKSVTAQAESKELNGEKVTKVQGIIWGVDPLSLKDSIVQGFKGTWAIILEFLGALKNLTKSREGLGGPVMIISQVTQCLSLGFKMFLFMLAFISINLAVFNLLPLPILDGGQALFYTIEAIKGKPLSENIKYKIHYYTWILIILLTIYLTFNDFIRIVKPHISSNQTSSQAK